MLDYLSVESQFLDSSAIDSLSSADQFAGSSTTPSIFAGYGNLPLPSDAGIPDKSKAPGHLNPLDSSYDYGYSDFLSNDVVAGTTLPSESTPCAQESERDGPGAELTLLQHAPN